MSKKRNVIRNAEGQTLADYIEDDRQWRREHRIANAAFKLRRAHEAQQANEEDFYQRVLRANLR